MAPAYAVPTVPVVPALHLLWPKGTRRPKAADWRRLKASDVSNTVHVQPLLRLRLPPLAPTPCAALHTTNRLAIGGGRTEGLYGESPGYGASPVCGHAQCTAVHRGPSRRRGVAQSGRISTSPCSSDRVTSYCEHRERDAGQGCASRPTWTTVSPAARVAGRSAWVTPVVPAGPRTSTPDSRTPATAES